MRHTTSSKAASPGDENRTEAASYIAELAGDLAHLARRNRFDTLAYLLEIARLEADSVGRLYHDDTPDRRR